MSVNVPKWIFRNDDEPRWTEPDASRLPVFRRFDADPAIDAEEAVERGVATPEEEEYVEAMEDVQPIYDKRGDVTKIEHSAPPGEHVAHAVPKLPTHGNPDGTFTTEIHDPRKRKR